MPDILSLRFLSPKPAGFSQSVLTLLLALIISVNLQAQMPEPAEDWTETEQKVYDLISEDGYYVVHFWATWCHNSKNELEAEFWPELIREHEDVEFIFVTIRNDGREGRDMLRNYNIPDRVIKLGQPEIGAFRNPRNRTFMSLPSYWTPSTWIFHKNGKLAYAINNGEVRKGLIDELLNDTKKNWNH